ncbi:hypothetical protein PHMEG_00011374 [Phytophthora megakarya]|uniref:M96 mating-specific protein n=1 Tax=Phytophthora megakarya TaxID=4795 RepID=A0A225WCC1_9STRA|nr:hypothetical protein PHMEG_00011374 [Phytophthora megakarya]
MKKMRSATQNEREALGWKAVAKWSLEERQVSEANRRWLLAAISGKKALIEDLMSVVRQHMLLVNATSRSCRHTALFYDPPDDIVFAIDMQDIEKFYRQTDSIFNTCGLDPTSTKTTTFQQTVTKDNDGVSIRLVRRQHFLFGYKHTWQSVWMLSHMMHRQEDREDYGGIEDPENTIATKFRITKQLPGGTRVSLKERFVVRKFEETNRTIIIWKASLTGEGSFSGMQTELTGWSIIRPSTTDSGCVVDVCMLHVPLHLKNPDVAPDIMADRFSEFLQSIIQENSQEITSGSKALLLEHMLTGIDL